VRLTPTDSRVLRDFERRGAIEISGRHSIVLRNHSTNGKGERLAEFFEGVKGRRPKTEGELQEWFVSPEGKDRDRADELTREAEEAFRVVEPPKLPN
jgi:hypothetical protein